MLNAHHEPVKVKHMDRKGIQNFLVSCVKAIKSSTIVPSLKRLKEFWMIVRFHRYEFLLDIKNSCKVLHQLKIRLAHPCGQPKHLSLKMNVRNPYQMKVKGSIQQLTWYCLQSVHLRTIPSLKRKRMKPFKFFSSTPTPMSLGAVLLFLYRRKEFHQSPTRLSIRSHNQAT